MRKEVIAVLVLFSTAVIVASPLLHMIIAEARTSQHPYRGEAWAVTEFKTPFGFTVIDTKSGAKVVFDAYILSVVPDSSVSTCCGWYLVNHQVSITGGAGRQWVDALHKWSFAHGICLPYIGCIVDATRSYTAGVSIDIWKNGHPCIAIALGTHVTRVDARGACR